MALDASARVSVPWIPAPAARGRRHRRGLKVIVPAERELVVAAHRGGVRERQELIQRFKPLIASMARAYRHSQGVEIHELMQEGCVGLLEALRHYDPDLGVPFGAYARWWVCRAIQQLVSELSGPVVLPERATRQLVRVNRARREYEQTQGRGPRASELAAACGLPSAQVESLIAAARGARTLTVPSGEEDGDGRTGGVTLVDPRGEDDYEAALWRLAAAQLPELLDGLQARERLVIRARYGIEGPERTRAELARELRVSAERVRQIEQAALGKLSAACERAHERADGREKVASRS
jgi:RNA polymerase primary sigma factor